MENPLYAKIFKWISWVFIIVSVILAVWAFTRFGGSGEGAAVEVLLYLAYAMVVLALVAVLCVGLFIAAKNDPKSLVKLGIVLIGAAAVCFVVYLISPGNPALNLNMDQPSASTLKLVDTVLNLTYITGGLAILAIICGEIWSAIRK